MQHLRAFWRSLQAKTCLKKVVQLANQNLLYKCQQFMPDMRVVKTPILKPYVGLLTFSAALPCSRLRDNAPKTHHF